MRIAVYVCLLSTGFFSAGCASTENRAASPRPGDSLSRTIDSPDVNAVLSEAYDILKRDFAGATIDRDQRVVTSDAVEFSSTRDTGTPSDFVGVPNTLRRIALVSCEPAGSGVMTRVRVDVERRDTQRRQIMQRSETQFGDTPRQTAIERDAATSSRQNDVWTRIRRDRALEQQILTDIQNRFAPDEPATKPSDE
ncbi:MAG: hypothetical protein JNG88_05330 [Phycisphaerales bacterium]|nr:hypothetical protein [Phycisphaerales bacterium]